MRLTAGLALAAVLALNVPADAARGRTLVAPYRGTTTIAVPMSEGGSAQAFGPRCGASCVSFTVGRNEKRATITVTDASGAKVGWVVAVGQQLAASGCGAGELALRRGQQLWVTVAVVPGCVTPTVGELQVVVSG